MNARDQGILTDLLKSEEYWEPIRESRVITGYKLKLKKVYEDLHNFKQVLFYDQVYFPRAQRMMRLVKAMGIVPEAVGWQEMEVGFDKSFMIWYPCQTDWQDFLSREFEPYFERLWYSEWMYEEPSEEEMMVLGIMPESRIPFQVKLFS